jgi:hypothetical protein
MRATLAHGLRIAALLALALLARGGRAELIATASSSREGHEPALAVDADLATVWESAGGGEQWLALDLGAPQSLGGVFVDWDGVDHATHYRVEVSADGEHFERVRSLAGANGGRDSIYLGRIDARWVRLALEHSAADRYAIRRVEIVTSEALPSPNEFFHALAAGAMRGAYPRYWLREQPYWTAIGVDGDDRQALLSTDGQLEVDIRSFSIEPFLTIDGRFVPWSTAFPEPTLADGALPVPTVTWHTESVELSITVFAAGEPGASALYARYRLENRGAAPVHTDLWLGLRPFQVNPPWQSLNGAGGVSAIHHVARDGRVVRVNGSKAIALLTDPDGFGAVRFEQGSLGEFVARGELPPGEGATDEQGFAWGALRYRFQLAPGASAEASIAVPFHDPAPFLRALPGADEVPATVEAALDATRAHWRERLAPIDVRLPAAADPFVPALRAAIGQILIARAGPMLRPGTRTYARSWIRDGVMMSNALLQMGLGNEARAFLGLYLPYQEPDGRVPCCVDARGGDSAVENDAPGELVYGVLSLYRYERDVGFVRASWPHVVRAVDYIDGLRRQRLGPEYDAPALRAFRGLLPESISHEGYAAHPVHSYWDDYWALRGLMDAAIGAELLGEREDAARIATIRDAFASDLRASIVATMERHALTTIPASVELGDFDPSATSIALAPGGLRDLLPADALERTYDRYVTDFRKRRAGEIAWEAYTPYELRNVETLVRLGRRDDALFLLRKMVGDQRPAGWRQWGEIVWRDPTAPRFIGDVPHCWIESSYVSAFRSLLVYEREDGALVLGAGLPLDWLRAEGGVAAKGLGTYAGPLGFAMSAADHTLVATIDAGVEVPREGIVVRAPVAIRAARVDGEPAKEWGADGVTVRAVPARIEIEY